MFLEAVAVSWFYGEYDLSQAGEIWYQMLQEPGNNHYKLHVFLADFVHQCHKFEVQDELLHKD